MKRRRCVVDINVLISALLPPGGQTAQALETIRTANGVMLFSDEMFAELATPVMRPKFDRYVEPALRRQFLTNLAGCGEWVTISGTLEACRDSEDDKFLETAHRGRGRLPHHRRRRSPGARSVSRTAHLDGARLPGGTLMRGAGPRPA
jgi:uncharacterized protein